MKQPKTLENTRYNELAFKLVTACEVRPNNIKTTCKISPQELKYVTVMSLHALATAQILETFLKCTLSSGVGIGNLLEGQEQ